MKKVIASLSILVFFTAPLFCCCLAKTVHANQVSSKSIVSHCHKSTDKKQHESDSCQCIKAKADLAQKKLIVDVDQVVSLLKFPPPVDSEIVYLHPNFLLFTDHSPPKLSSSNKPLYIQQSNLRI